MIVLGDAVKYIVVLGLLIMSVVIPGFARTQKPNILIVSVDDLRPELGCYGNSVIQTPSFDRFAQQGMAFKQAYCQNASCAPSRASFMIGKRPDSTRVWRLGERFRDAVPDTVTMPEYFKRHGYHTLSMGKVYHNHMPDKGSFDEPDLRPASYNTPELIDRDPESFYYDGEIREEHAKVAAERMKKNPRRSNNGWAYGRAVEIANEDDEVLYDGAQTTLAIETLKRLKEKNQPFYFKLGYYRPHLPFVAPKTYWDLYDRDTLPLASNDFLPLDAPPMAINSQGEMRACYDMEFVGHPAEYTMPEEYARKLKHGYYASVSYVDACFGRLMDGLEELGLADNTIVVVWGDHGWKLGEHNSWCKQTNYLIDTRVPLLIRVPKKVLEHHSSEALVELVDVFPTLCELAEIDTPSDMEGTSFAPLLTQPDQEWKKAVFAQYIHNLKENGRNQRYMGYSIYNGDYHYVQWRKWDPKTKKAGDIVAEELYDIALDPQENKNVAAQTDYDSRKEKIALDLQKGWIQALPNGVAVPKIPAWKTLP